MVITYTRQGDYNLPNLTLHSQPQAELGYYAYLRRRFLREHHKIMYFNLLTSCNLLQHLYETEQAASAMEDKLVRQLTQQQGVTERMKAQDQLGWVLQMNNIRHTAREIVLHEIIYVV